MRRVGKFLAFTLLELLLVLAVMATLSAIALPRVSRMLAKAEHRAAADGLRAALSGLRLRAIQTGQSHSFRFVPGTGLFEMRAEADDEVRQIDFDELTPAASPLLDDSLEQPDEGGIYDPRAIGGKLVDWAGADTLTHAVEEDSVKASREGEQIDRRQLAGDMVIVLQVPSIATEIAAADDLTSATLVDSRGGSQDGSQTGFPLDVSLQEDSSAGQWSAPILFYPDGRASDGRLFVVDPSGYAIELAVVGISGRVHVGERRRLPEGTRPAELSPAAPAEPMEEIGVTE